MKKMLLFAAAALVAASASAATEVLGETDFTKATSYNFWKSDVTNAEVKDGALVITNAEKTENFWDLQYMVVDNVTLVGSTEYTVDVKIKGFSGQLHYNLGTWGSNVGGEVEVKESSDWQNVVFKATPKEDTDGTAHLLLQSGDFVGTYSIASVKITYGKSEGGDTPDEPKENVLATYFDGKGNAFGGWPSGFSNVDEDGKPCLKFENAEAKNSWEFQAGIDYDYQADTKYFLSFDIKGTAGKFTAGFQYAGKNNAGEQVYWGCGDLTPCEIATEWKNVVLEGTAKAAEEGQNPGRIVLNLGDYVGTFFMTNVKLYTLGESAVDAVVVAPAVREGVYNLQGVKVADSLDEVTLPGLYIANGKKYIKK